MEMGESSMEIESKYIIAADRREAAHKSSRGLPVFLHAKIENQNIDH